jgi:hypothetical protein
MYNIRNREDLESAILLIENEVDEQRALLAEQMKLVYESFSPVNVVKGIFSEVVNSDTLRSNILTAGIGISTGYLIKKLLFGKKKNSLNGIFGNLLQYGVANLVINPSRILNAIKEVLQIFIDPGPEAKSPGKKKSRKK